MARGIAQIAAWLAHRILVYAVAAVFGAAIFSFAVGAYSIRSEEPQSIYVPAGSPGTTDPQPEKEEEGQGSYAVAKVESSVVAANKRASTALAEAARMRLATGPAAVDEPKRVKTVTVHDDPVNPSADSPAVGCRAGGRATIGAL
jgi:hypothetical protein